MSSGDAGYGYRFLVVLSWKSLFYMTMFILVSVVIKGIEGKVW